MRGTAIAPKTRLGIQSATAAGQLAVLREEGAEREQRVVAEDEADAEQHAERARAARAPDAERDAEQREEDRRDREREPAVILDRVALGRLHAQAVRRLAVVRREVVEHLADARRGHLLRALASRAPRRARPRRRSCSRSFRTRRGGRCPRSGSATRSGCRRPRARGGRARSPARAGSARAPPRR